MFLSIPVYESMILTERKQVTGGSQYRCGRVGRGIQPRSTPQPPPHTQTYTKSSQNARFSTFRLGHYGRTNGLMDRRMDKASYRVASPRLTSPKTAPQSRTVGRGRNSKTTRHKELLLVDQLTD